MVARSIISRPAAGPPPSGFTFEDNFTTGVTTGLLNHSPDPGPGVWEQIGPVNHADGIQVYSPGNDARTRRNSLNYYRPADSSALNEADHWVYAETADANSFIGPIFRWASASDFMRLLFWNTTLMRVQKWNGGIITETFDFEIVGGLNTMAAEVSGNQIRVWVDEVEHPLSPQPLTAPWLTGTNFGLGGGNTRSDGSQVITRLQCGTGAYPRG